MKVYVVTFYDRCSFGDYLISQRIFSGLKQTLDYTTRFIQLYNQESDEGWEIKNNYWNIHNPEKIYVEEIKVDTNESYLLFAYKKDPDYERDYDDLENSDLTLEDLQEQLDKRMLEKTEQI